MRSVRFGGKMINARGRCARNKPSREESDSFELLHVTATYIALYL